MSETRFAANKPETCLNCRFMDCRTKVCKLGVERCYYILPEIKEKEPESPCDGCPYAKDHPCLGFCLKDCEQRGTSQ